MSEGGWLVPEYVKVPLPGGRLARLKRWLLGQRQYKWVPFMEAAGYTLVDHGWIQRIADGGDRPKLNEPPCGQLDGTT